MEIKYFMSTLHQWISRDLFFVSWIFIKLINLIQIFLTVVNKIQLYMCQTMFWNLYKHRLNFLSDYVLFGIFTVYDFLLYILQLICSIFMRHININIKQHCTRKSVDRAYNRSGRRCRHIKLVNRQYIFQGNSHR